MGSFWQFKGSSGGLLGDLWKSTTPRIESGFALLAVPAMLLRGVNGAWLFGAVKLALVCAAFALLLAKVDTDARRLMWQRSRAAVRPASVAPSARPRHRRRHRRRHYEGAIIARCAALWGPNLLPAGAPAGRHMLVKEGGASYLRPPTRDIPGAPGQ